MEQYVIVDSTLRDTTLYPYGNSYTTHLTNPLNNVTRIELVQAIVPNIIFNVKTGVNVMQIDGSTYSIAPGTYSQTSLASVIQAAIYLTTGIEVNYNTPQHAFIFYRPTADPRGNFTIVFTPEFARLLGFSDTLPKVSSSVASAVLPGVVPLFSSHEFYAGYTFIRSDTLDNLRTDSYIYLDVEELNNGKTQSTQKLEADTFSTSASQRTFCPIPMNVSPGSIKVFQENTDYKYSINFDPPIQQLSRLTVKWRRSSGDLMEFRSIDENSFVLRVFSKKMQLPEEVLEHPKEDAMFPEVFTPNPTIYLAPLSRLGD